MSSLTATSFVVHCFKIVPSYSFFNLTFYLLQALNTGGLLLFSAFFINMSNHSALFSVEEERHASQLAMSMFFGLS